jgi:hypothetical protein
LTRSMPHPVREGAVNGRRYGIKQHILSRK